jgi:general stress protein YciG
LIYNPAPVFFPSSPAEGVGDDPLNPNPTEKEYIMVEKSKRGFAIMDVNKRRDIASKGGKAAHAKGTAHEFTPEEARAAGRKGGQAAHQRGTAHQFTPEEAREAGRKGGRAASHRGHRQQAPQGNGESHPPQAQCPPEQPPAEMMPTPPPLPAPLLENPMSR